MNDTTTDDTPASGRQRAMNEIDRVADELSLSDGVVSVAQGIYDQSYENELYHGRPFEAVLGAIVHLGARTVGEPRPTTRIADAVDSSEDEILDAARHLTKRLPIEPKPFDPQPFVEQFCKELNLSESFTQTAIDIVECAVDEGLHSGRSPTGFAAGAMYAATCIESASVTQSELAETADVSEVTIRNCYQDQLNLYKSVE